MNAFFFGGGEEPRWLIFHSKWEIIEECGSVFNTCLRCGYVAISISEEGVFVNCQMTSRDVKCIGCFITGNNESMF